MTRISTAMISGNALSNLQRAQTDMFEAQRRSSSQNVEADMKGYGRNAQTLVNSQRLRARAEGFIEVGNELKTRLMLQDTHLDRAANAVNDLRQRLTEALAIEETGGVMANVDEAFEAVKTAFNSSLNGRYMFGGTRNDVAPVQATDLADLAANPIADALTPDASTQTLRVEDDRTVTTAPLASDAAQETLESLRRLKLFEDGASGPFQSPLDDNQRQILRDEIAALSTAYENLLAVQGENGRALQTTENAIDRQSARRDTLAQVAGDISDVDLAEVAVQLSQAQSTFQASASIFNTIRGLSLIDYLR